MEVTILIPDFRALARLEVGAWGRQFPAHGGLVLLVRGCHPGPPRVTSLEQETLLETTRAWEVTFQGAVPGAGGRDRQMLLPRATVVDHPAGPPSCSGACQLESWVSSLPCPLARAFADILC